MLTYLLLLAAFSTPAITVDVTPQVGIAPIAIRIKTQIERVETNREVCIYLTGPAYSTSSCESLDGAQGPRTFWRTWERLPEGEYEVVGVLRRSEDGKDRVIRSRPVQVKALGTN